MKNINREMLLEDFLSYNKIVLDILTLNMRVFDYMVRKDKT
jgi:hypothetical protein